MILDLKISELGKIVTDEDAAYHVFVWSKLRPLNTITIDGHEYSAPPIKAMTFGEVVDLKKFITSSDFNDKIRAVEIVYKISFETLSEMKAIKFFPLLNYITKEIEVIAENEAKTLSGDYDSDMINAGVEELSQFGVITTIDTLANGDVLKWQSILDMRYSTVFTKLYLNKVKAKIETEYQKILDRKRKNKKG
jgi:hypothetical protein